MASESKMADKNSFLKVKFNCQAYNSLRFEMNPADVVFIRLFIFACMRFGCVVWY
jgi:hypothetical protein